MLYTFLMATGGVFVLFSLRILIANWVKKHSKHLPGPDGHAHPGLGGCHHCVHSIFFEPEDEEIAGKASPSSSSTRD
jgi:hypothetical protein